MQFNHHHARVGLLAIAAAMENSDPQAALKIRQRAAEVAEQHDTMFVIAEATAAETTSPKVASAAGRQMRSKDPAARSVAASALAQAADKPKPKKKAAKASG